MPFHSIELPVKPRVGVPMSLGRSHVDTATLTLTFYYQEQVRSGSVWSTVGREQTLAVGEHFTLDARNGTVTLLGHPFWQQESTWREGGKHGRVEQLLYKGRVKHPQYVRAEFEYYAPKSVKQGSRADLSKKNAAAKKRLGYDMPEYGVGL